MKYRIMGKSGVAVSRVCLGTMTFGKSGWGCDKKTSIEIVHAFLDKGGNFIDTADVYSSGESEEYVGEALKSRKREEIVLATKCFLSMNDKNPNAKGLSRKHITEACNASLRRLKTDYIDLYQIHGPDPITPLDETMRAMDDLVKQGKILYTGCCNLYVYQIVKANGISDKNNLSRLVCAQHLYNMIIRDVEREILAACSEEEMGFICWSPLASGMLTGKYKKSEKPEQGTRVAMRAELDLPRYWNERGFKIIDNLVKVSKKHGIPAYEIALSWLLFDKRVTSVIIGAKTTEQLDMNMSAGEFDLTAEIYDELTRDDDFNLGYPKQWIDFSQKKFFDSIEF